MSNNDNQIIIERGRPYSADINDLQSLQNRVRAEALRWMLADEDQFGIYSNRSYVLGGLNVSGSSITSVSISAGVLAQYSTTLVPTPDTLDSPMRIGRLETAFVQVIPTNAGIVYYVLEAQVSRVQVTETMDQLNAITGEFEAVPVATRDTFTVVFQLVAGTPGGVVPTPTGGDWVALAVVRKPAGAGVVAPADVWHVATRWGDAGAQGQVTRPYPGLHVVQAYLGSIGGADALAHINSFQPAYIQGLPLYAATNAGFTASDAEFVASGTTISADTWYYVYLCAWHGLAPLNAHISISAFTSGIIAVSSVTPSPQPNGTRVNSSAITTSTTSRWSSVVPVGAAMCIGAIRRNAGNTGWNRNIAMDHENILFGDTSMYISLGSLATDTGGSAFTDVVLASPSVFPLSARSVKLKVHIPQSSGASTYGYVISIKDTGGGGTTYYSVAGAIPQGVSYQEDVYLDVPISACGTSFSVAVLNIGNSNIASTISLIGYSW